MQATRTDAAEIELSYHRYGSALVLFAAALTGDRSRAQDAVHQVFLELLESGSRSLPTNCAKFERRFPDS